MHQQPPKTPLFASISPANASQLDSSRASIVYRDPTTNSAYRARRHSTRLGQRPGMTPERGRSTLGCEGAADADSHVAGHAHEDGVGQHLSLLQVARSVPHAAKAPLKLTPMSPHRLARTEPWRVPSSAFDPQTVIGSVRAVGQSASSGPACWRLRPIA